MNLTSSLMDAKYKYFYILTFFACLLSSCSSEEPRNAGVKGSEVEFEVSDATRASVTSNINTLGSKFVVFGDRKLDGSQSDPVVVFNKTEVEYTASGWSYVGTQYWFPGHEHSFVALYPLSVLESDDLQYSGSKISFTYRLPSDENNVIKKDGIQDILSATHRRLVQENDILNKISFRFSHLLSLINISPALDDNNMEEDEFFLFRKLEFSGVRTKGVFNIEPAKRQSNSQTGDYVVEVVGQEQVANLSINFTAPVKVSNNRKNVKLFDDNDAIIMLPQVFTVDSDAEIILYYSINEDPAIRQVTLPFNSKNWVSGKSYNYKFTINRTGLLFETADITDWDVLTVGNINAH